MPEVLLNKLLIELKIHFQAVVSPSSSSVFEPSSSNDKFCIGDGDTKGKLSFLNIPQVYFCLFVDGFYGINIIYHLF